MKDWIKGYVSSYKSTLDSIPVESTAKVIDTLKRIYQEDRQIFVFGNGGSAANASHFITDLGKGVSDKLKRRFRCLSLNEHMGWITALGNDYAYDEIFVGQLRNFGRPGDAVMVMSVSGNSPNLVKAVEWANQNSLTTIAMVGKKRGKLAEIAQQVLVIDSEHYGRVEDVHMTLCHIFAYSLMENPQWIEA